MLERDLEAYLRELVKKYGGVLFKLDARSRKGSPDRVVTMPGRPTTYVELKTDTGRVSPLQAHTHDQIRKAGGRVVVLRGLGAIEMFVVHGVAEDA
jgi:hypothetical protein